MKTLLKTELGSFLEGLAAGRRVIAPLVQGAEVELGELDPAKLAVDYQGRTRFSAKEFLFPESELMFTVEKRPDGEVQIAEHVPEQETAVWGVRPCDLAGIQVLDAVFLAPPADPQYAARRAHTLLLGLNCNQVGTSCFCGSLGTGPFARSGFDLLFTDLGDRFLVEDGSEAGRGALEEHPEHLEAAGPEDEEEARQQQAAADAGFSLELDVEALRRALKDAFEDPIWEEQSRKCTLCGTCCIVCPACHCFNVEDVRKGRKAFQRLRYWDSCQFTGFTRMAAENSRPEQRQRWRQKIYDKFLYIPAGFGGLLGCTGCGRCLDLCQGSINIVQVLKDVSTRTVIDAG